MNDPVKLSRAFASPIEIRAGSDGEGRTVGGIIVPFDTIATVSDGGKPYREAFQRGAFSAALHNMGGKFGRVKLLSQHQSSRNPLGMATGIEERADGLYGEFKVSNTRAGDEALELVRDGAIDSFSVGFTPQKHSVRDGVTWRTTVGLREASLVTFPAYADAVITGIREEWDGLSDEMREQAMAWLREQAHNLPPVEGVDPSALDGVPADEAHEALRSGNPLFLQLRLQARKKGVL